MKWPTAKLILIREVRDQLRDRRTLFMILILPMVLYPVLGLGLFQLTLSFGKQQRTVGVVGAEYLPSAPPLLAEDNETFHPSLFGDGGSPGGIKVVLDDKLSRDDIERNHVDAILEILPNTAERLARGDQASIRILYKGSNDNSEIAHSLVRDLVWRWSKQVLAKRVKGAGLADDFTEPVSIEDGVEDVTSGTGRSGTAWSRMFPFLLVMMALTGAFYPAVDLCAGEKERGTMETLLISPASRAEIALGKFLAIFLFSIASTVVNLTSMGLTFAQTSRMIPEAIRDSAAGVLAPPSLVSIGWMFLLMLPLAAFFSALCMALAIFARSTKEGQYYLMPLFLIVTPLVFVTLAPGVELNAFYSLVPVTNIALLLKALLLNQYDTAAVYFLPVMVPTILYGFLALRYATDQFNREEVLFREAERFDLRDFLRRLFWEKKLAPTFQQAWAFFVVYMMLRWYLQGRLSLTPAGLITGQVATLLLPAIVMAFLLTKRPLEALNLRRPALLPTLAALALVFTIHPVAISLASALQRFLPTPDVEGLGQALMPLFERPLWERMVLLVLVPAICEEFAFRGFILSGFLQHYRPPLAILISSVLFGVSHMIPQQMVATTLLGIVLGIVATRTGSIGPSILVHALHNGMVIMYMHNLAQQAKEAGVDKIPEGIATYPVGVVVMGALATALLIGLLVSQPSRLKRIARSTLFDSESSPAPLARVS